MKKTTMANKSRLIRDTLKLNYSDTELLRRDLVDANPLTWMLEVDVILVDARHAPAWLQVLALEQGFIPTSLESAVSRRDEVGGLLEAITVDCDNLAEQVTAFYEAFAETFAELVPVLATVAGATVRVSAVEIAENGEELTARCERGTWRTI